MDEKHKLKKLPDPSEDFLGSCLKIYASGCVVVAPEGITQVGVIHCPIEKYNFAMLIVRPARASCLTSLKKLIKTVKSIQSA